MDAKAFSWQDLQVFLATARGGSLSAAGSAAGLSPATVMRRLRELERELGSALFARSSRGYTLTEAGRLLLAHVEQMEAQVLAAHRLLGGGDQRLSGTLRLATLDDLMQTVLGPVVASFAERHPGVCMEVLIGTEHTDLSRRSADVAIRAGRRPTSGELVPKRLGTVGVALYARRDYLDAHPLTTPDCLDGHRVVRADEAHAGLAMERALDRIIGTGVVTLRSNSMLARVVAVRAGVGVGLLPCFAADQEPALVRIGPVLPEASAELWILTHPDLRQNARVRAFVAHACDAFAVQREVLAGTA